MKRPYVEPFEDESLVSYLDRMINDFGFSRSELIGYLGTRYIFYRAIMNLDHCRPIAG